MFVKIDRPKKNAKGITVTGNKESCATFANYLDKETREEKKKGNHLDANMFFFNQDYDVIEKSTAIERVDNNIKKLKRNDAKFFTLSINPSHKEIQHVIEKVTGKQNVQHLDELNGLERKMVYAEFRDYTRNTMTLYAQNFNREKVKDGNDLVYFARIEKQRKYSINDKAVKEGRGIKGEIKPGLNLHVQVCVSRNDITQTVSLTPLIQTRGRKIYFNGKLIQQGFDHAAFKIKTANLFSTQFNYTMNSNEQFKIQQQQINQKRERYIQNRKMATEIELLGKKFGTSMMTAVLPPEVLRGIYLVKSGIRTVRSMHQIARELSMYQKIKLKGSENEI
jgi:hypothetical protein